MNRLQTFNGMDYLSILPVEEPEAKTKAHKIPITEEQMALYRAERNEEIMDSVKAAIEEKIPARIERLNLRTLEAERLDETIPVRTWNVDQMITPGINAVVAKKSAGKSFFIMEMANAIGEGKPFLGFKTKQSFILYVSFELDRIAIHERAQVSGKCSENVFVTYTWESKGIDALSDAFRVAAANNFKVIIFDMFHSVMPEDYTNSLYELTTQWLRKWRMRAIENQIAIVGAFHAPKNGAGEDPIAQLIGSAGQGGQCDSIIHLDRKRGESIAKIFVGGNHAPERIYKAQFENCVWSRIEGAENFLSIGDSELLKIVNEAATGINVTDVAATCGRSYNSIRVTLAKLARSKYIAKIGRGLYAPVNTETTEINRNISLLSVENSE